METSEPQPTKPVPPQAVVDELAQSMRPGTIDAKSEAAAAEAASLKDSAPDCTTGDCCKCLTMAELNRKFDEFKADTSYPWFNRLNCCFTRAQKMLDSIDCAGAHGKIWVYSNGRDDITVTDPDGKIIAIWRYHVAPLVKVCEGGEMVIDPSLFDEPVTQKTWLDRMNNVFAHETTRTKSPYHPPYFGNGPDVITIAPGLYVSRVKPTNEDMNRTFDLHALEHIMMLGLPIPKELEYLLHQNSTP